MFFIEKNVNLLGVCPRLLWSSGHSKPSFWSNFNDSTAIKKYFFMFNFFLGSYLSILN